MAEALDGGRALERFRQLVEAQGGDPRVLDHPTQLPQARVVEPVRSPVSGYVVTVHPRSIGQTVVGLGGGRQTMVDEIDPAVGVEVHVKPGDAVGAATPLATIHASSADAAAVARRALEDAIVVGPEPGPPPLPLVSHRVTVGGVERVA